jgi:hypothetical protein
MPKDYDGKTPLDFAESGEFIQLLKKHGAVEKQDVMPEDADKQGKSRPELRKPV